MTVDDIDVFRSAAMLINQHGEEAPIHATMKADDMLGLTWRSMLSFYQLTKIQSKKFQLFRVLVDGQRVTLGPSSQPTATTSGAQ